MTESPKPKLKVKEILTDIQAGLGDLELMRKYKLTAAGLQTVLNKLLEGGFLKQSDLDKRAPMFEKTVDLGFRCPACGTFQLMEFDECPICGVIVSQYHLVQKLRKQVREVPATKGISPVPLKPVPIQPPVQQPSGKATPAVGPQPESLNDQLIVAARSGRLEEVKRLLDQGADVNARGMWGLTPLIWASSKGHLAVVNLLVQRGADVDARANNQSTALMWTCFAGFREVARILLERGANVHAKSNSGATALIAATEKGHHQLVALLKARGAVE
jgi:hypothetical protein